MINILAGDCREVLKTMADEIFDCCITSPPYYGLRDYDNDKQIGLEQTPQEYVTQIVNVLREVKRTLKNNGTLWLNLGDSYAGSGKGQTATGSADKKQPKLNGMKLPPNTGEPPAKNLIGIPWRVAFALQEDGWYLRQDIIWHKPNAMPEPIKDRCSKAHEYIFLPSKNKDYYFDYEAIKEPLAENSDVLYRQKLREGKEYNSKDPYKKNFPSSFDIEKRNKRSVWTVNTKPYMGSHCATYPAELIEPCILAGCPIGGIVLDPFGGGGTTGMTADRLGRNSTLIELNPAYVEIIKDRIHEDAGMFGVINA